MKQTLITTIAFICIAFTNICNAQIVYSDTVLTNGEVTRPHQIYSDKEKAYYQLPSYDGQTYWVVNSTDMDELILDNCSFWGLLYNDFYLYYHDAEIDVYSELSKKVFERSELYNQMQEEMNINRSIILSDTIHLPLTNFVNYNREYDINKGGFLIKEELDNALPPFLSDSSSKNKSHQTLVYIGCSNHFSAQSNNTNNFYPKYFSIPNSLKDKILSAKDRRLSFFIPLANEEIALNIEKMNRPYAKTYDLLMQIHYVEKPVPHVELVDILLLQNKDNRIIWTLSKGDLSDAK